LFLLLCSCYSMKITLPKHCWFFVMGSEWISHKKL
jgi:hypothetical protein